MLKTEKNYRIIFNEMVSYLRDLGLVVNTNTKARGHQGFFLKNRKVLLQFLTRIQTNKIIAIIAKISATVTAILIKVIKPCFFLSSGLIACSNFVTVLKNSGEVRILKEIPEYLTAPIKVGDKILIHEKLVDVNWSGYTQPYAFELNQTMLPKQVMLNNDVEFVVLGSGNKNFVLKRIYG